MLAETCPGSPCALGAGEAAPAHAHADGGDKAGPGAQSGALREPRGVRAAESSRASRGLGGAGCCLVQEKVSGPACSPRLCCKPAAPPPCACAGRHQPRGGHGCSLPAPVSGRHSLLETLRGVRAVPGALPSSRRSAIPVGNAGDLNSAADFTSTPHLLFRGFRFRGHRPARKG